MTQQFTITINWFYNTWTIQVDGILELFDRLDSLVKLYGKKSLTVTLN